MPISHAPRHRVTVQSVWRITDAENVPLTEATLARLGPYLARYGETMNVRVHAVGGSTDHLHLLYDLPFDQNVSDVTSELQRASARFLRDTLGVPDFAWMADLYTVSVSLDRMDYVAEYVASQDERHAGGGILDAALEGTESDDAESDKDETPAWLRDALQNGGSR